MSVQAAVNGAQRDIGLYAGIDGAVRALFENVKLKRVQNSATGSKGGVCPPVTIQLENEPVFMFALMSVSTDGVSFPDITDITDITDCSYGYLMRINGQQIGKNAQSPTYITFDASTGILEFVYSRYQAGYTFSICCTVYYI